MARAGSAAGESGRGPNDRSGLLRLSHRSKSGIGDARMVIGDEIANRQCRYTVNTSIRRRPQRGVYEGCWVLRIEGKTYVVKDRDVMHFRFNF